MSGLELVGGGGVAGLALVAFYFVKLFIDSRRRTKEQKADESSAAVTDQATANATLLNTLTAVQKENTRLVARIDALESELAVKDQRIDELEDRVRTLHTELQQVANEIGSLRHKKA